ncbi:MAG: hypothetical protein SOZ34_01530 [Clostridia bacterium]|nr:hypothetical protein [Clostridia bacterium]
MYLDLYSKDGHRYIRISESVRVEKNGVRVTRKKVIENVGPVSRFDDGKPDFEQRLKDSFKAGIPLIPELLPYVKKDIPKEAYHLTMHSDTDECVGEPKLFASCLFDKILDDIGPRSFVGTFKNYDIISYDVLGFLKLAVYGRILNHVSKIATVNQNDKYYSPILTGDFYEYNIYDSIAVFGLNKNFRASQSETFVMFFRQTLVITHTYSI